MPKKNYYLLSDGLLKRKENTIYFANEKGKKPIPINKIYSVYAYGQITISSQVINLFSKEGIPIHFFNYYGFYNGSYYPREKLLSGDLLIKQCENYINYQKRIELAKLFVEGSAKNILKVLSYYKIDNNIKEILSDLDKTSKTCLFFMADSQYTHQYFFHYPRQCQ